MWLNETVAAAPSRLYGWYGALRKQEGDARHHQPERPDDVGDGHQRAGKLPPGLLEGAEELERPDNQRETDDDAGPAQPCGKDVALGHGHAHEEGPEAGEQVAQVLTDGNAGIAMEGLEDDGDRIAGRLAGRRVKERASQIGNEVGPADQTEELHRGRENPECGGQ